MAVPSKGLSQRTTLGADAPAAGRGHVRQATGTTRLSRSEIVEPNSPQQLDDNVIGCGLTLCVCTYECSTTETTSLEIPSDLLLRWWQHRRTADWTQLEEFLAMGVGQTKQRDRIYDFFASYNTLDKGAVRRALRLLLVAGAHGWFAHDEVLPGQIWNEQVTEALSCAKAATVFLGPRGMGKHQEIEYQALQQRAARKELTIIPIILDTCGELPEIPVLLHGTRYADFRGANPEHAVRQVVRAIGRAMA